MGQLSKRAVDVAAASVLLLICAPLLVLLAIGVRLSSPGPVLYSQERLGRAGRSFRFFKFRSMVENSDEVFSCFLEEDENARCQWNSFQKLDRDPRITRFGRFIRRTSLDELPQLWNVLKGDMSLIGPRPCMPNQKILYGVHWVEYCAVRPGLTGLWQVSGRNLLTYEERVKLDARYVRSWSFWLDVKILAKTVSVVVSGHGSR